MHSIVVFVLAILALSRCGDAISLDRLLWKRHGGGVAPLCGEYRWPVRAVWLTMAMILFAAGTSKLMQGGIAWVTSDHFPISLVQRHYDPNPPAVRWGLVIAQHPFLSRPSAAAAIALELAAPLALVSITARRLVPAATFLMQVGIGVLMNVWFTPFLFAYVFWVPWEVILRPRPWRRSLHAGGGDATTQSALRRGTAGGPVSAIGSILSSRTIDAGRAARHGRSGRNGGFGGPASCDEHNSVE
jgi:hypothetical protein